MKRIKRLNTKNIAQMIVPLVAILVIGGIGSYTYLRSSGASINFAAQCGSDYTLLSSTREFHDTTKSESPVDASVAQLQVYHSASAKKLCILTTKTKDEGTGTVKLSARIDVMRDSGSGNWQGTYSNTDKTKYNAGTFKYFAGPVYLAYDSITPMTANDYIEAQGTLGDYLALIDLKLSPSGTPQVTSTY